MKLTFRPGFGWDGTWIDESHDMDHWEWRIFGPGWRWCNTWMEVRQESWDMDGGETSSGLRWDANIESWIELRRELEGCETLIYGLIHYLDRCKMEIYGPGWKWEGIWMEERQYSLALDSDGPGPGWKWDVHFETCVGLRWCPYGSGMQLLGPGWRWDVTWMEVICNYGDLGWGETRSGWRLVVNLGVWMELRGGWMAVRHKCLNTWMGI